MSAACLLNDDVWCVILRRLLSVCCRSVQALRLVSQTLRRIIDVELPKFVLSFQKKEEKEVEYAAMVLERAALSSCCPQHRGLCECEDEDDMLSLQGKQFLCECVRICTTKRVFSHYVAKLYGNDVSELCSEALDSRATILFGVAVFALEYDAYRLFCVSVDWLRIFRMTSYDLWRRLQEKLPNLLVARRFALVQKVVRFCRDNYYAPTDLHADFLQCVCLVRDDATRYRIMDLLVYPAMHARMSEFTEYSLLRAGLRTGTVGVLRRYLSGFAETCPRLCRDIIVTLVHDVVLSQSVSTFDWLCLNALVRAYVVTHVHHVVEYACQERAYHIVNRLFVDYILASKIRVRPMMVAKWIAKTFKSCSMPLSSDDVDGLRSLIQDVGCLFFPDERRPELEVMRRPFGDEPPLPLVIEQALRDICRCEKT